MPARCVVLRVRCPGPLGSCSPVCPLGVLCCMCPVPGHWAPVHRCARSVCCFACAVSWVTWLLFTSVPAWFVVLRPRCPGPLGCCSPVDPLGALLCWCGVAGHLAPVHRCARSVCCVVCAVSWATWLLFAGVRAPSFALLARCPGPLGSCSPVHPLGALLCWCHVAGNLAPVHRCARSVCCVVCAVSWATWPLFAGVRAPSFALRVRCPWPVGSCSLVRPLGALLCLCGVLGHLAPVHRCAHSVCCVVCAVSWATWLLFTGVPVRCVALRVRCPGSLGSCSPVCPRGLLCCVRGVLGHLAAVHRWTRSVCCSAGVVSRATWLLVTAVPAQCVVWFVRCPGPLGSCSPVCALRPLLCLRGGVGHLPPVHRCAGSVCCVARAASWATWLLFTSVPAWCVVLRVRCPGPLGSCSPLCPLGVLCCVCGVLGHLAPVHRCGRSVCCVAGAVSLATWLLFTGAPVPFLFSLCGVLGHLAPVHRCARSVGCVACAVSWATWLLFTGAPAPSVALLVRCLWPLGCCSPVSALRPLLCLCGNLGHLPLVQQCARSVCFVVCAVSWATWLLFTSVPAWCVVLRVRCPGPLGSCSPLCPLGVLCCVCGVLGHLAPVHRCGRSVCCVAGAVSLATWLLFTGAPVPFLFSLCGVLGHLAPVHRCARSVGCVACAVSWATWLLFTGAPAPSVALLVRCLWPLGCCSPVSALRPLLCLCGNLGHLPLVQRCARSVCFVACAVSWVTWLLFTGVTVLCVVLRVRCSRPLGSCSPVCPLGVLCCLYGVLGCLALVPRAGRHCGAHTRPSHQQLCRCEKGR